MYICKFDRQNKIFKKENQDLSWDKERIKDLFIKMIPDFGHKETGKHLYI